MKRLAYKFAPPFLKNWLKAYFIRQYRKGLTDKSVQEVFDSIYQRKLWGDKKSVSGQGSTWEHTKEIIAQLPILFKRYQIRSVLDLPCGDFGWMKQVDLEGIDYIGADIVQGIIDENNAQFANEQRRFLQINIIEDPLPEVDLLLCRDCFVHLSNDQIQRSLQNIRRHNIRYLLVTSFPTANSNPDILNGEWRKVNMAKAPFNLVAHELLNEKCPEGDGRHADKSLMLVDLQA